MSGDDLIANIRSAIIEKSLAMTQSPSMETANALLSEVERLIEDALDQGVDLPDEIFGHLASLKQLKMMTIEITAAMGAGDAETMDWLSKEAMSLSGYAPDDYETHPEIFQAIECCDIDAVLAQLKTYDVNSQHGQYGKTALYRAVTPMAGDASFPIMHALLDAGADPRLGLGEDTNVLQGFGFGVFDDGMVDDLETVIRKCVERGADLEQQSDKLRWTPLHSALNEWNTQVTEALLRVGANPNAATDAAAPRCTAGQNCLAMAIGRPREFELLLRFGADPDRPDPWGRTTSDLIDGHLESINDDAFLNDLKACAALLKARQLPN